MAKKPQEKHKTPRRAAKPRTAAKSDEAVKAPTESAVSSIAEGGTQRTAEGDTRRRPAFPILADRGESRSRQRAVSHGQGMNRYPG